MGLLGKVWRRLGGGAAVRETGSSIDPSSARIYFMGARVMDALAIFAALGDNSQRARAELLVELTNRVKEDVDRILRRSSPDCVACGNYGHGYMLEDDVWKAAAREGERFLCLACVQDRLGRRLLPSDFPSDIRINDPIFAAFMIGRGDDEIVVRVGGVPPIPDEGLYR